MGVVEDIKKRFRRGGDLNPGDYQTTDVGATTMRQPVERTTATPQAQAEPELPPVTNYADMVARLTPQQTPEQIEKENRRMRSRRNIAALSDTISAIANLGSTMAGAPSAVEPRQSLSAVSKARWNEMKRERERNSQIYHQAMLRAAQLDESRQRQRQLADYQRQSIALRKEEEARRQSQMRLADKKLDWQQKYQQGLLDVKKEQLEIDRDYKEGRISIDQRNAESRALQAQASMLRAQKSGQPRPVQEKETTSTTTTTKPNGDVVTVEKRTTTGAKRSSQEKPTRQQSSTPHSTPERRSSGGSSSNTNKAKGNKRKSKTTV